MPKIYLFSIWSKVILLNAPPLKYTTPVHQNLVDETLTKIRTELGPQCYLFNLHYTTMFDNWDDCRMNYLRKADEVVPLPIKHLNRTAKNFSLLLAVALQVFQRELTMLDWRHTAL